MTSILKGLAALIAVLTVNVGGAHVGVVNKPVNHSATVSKAAPDTTINSVGNDSDLMHGRAQVKLIPTPAPSEAPADAPAANQPLAQLPIAAPAPRPAAPPPAPAPAPAPPPIVVGSTQQALINQDRAGAGLGALTWNSCLAGIAYQNAVRMANAGAISHAGGANADLGCGLGQNAGENVGYWSGGVNDSQLNTMFMNSPGHRANIMSSNYHYVGTSWVVAKNGYAYIAVEFS
jgi:uncharacterized protein YkwD